VKALEITNEFRKFNGLYAVAWNQALCDIGKFIIKKLLNFNIYHRDASFQKYG